MSFFKELVKHTLSFNTACLPGVLFAICDEDRAAPAHTL